MTIYEVTNLQINHFEKPIIILAAPRSGSTLLFETMTNLPDVWTIGGESHAAIEHIPELSTVFNGFHSNELTQKHATQSNIETLKKTFLQLLRNRDGKTLHSEAHKQIRFLEKTPKNTLRVSFLNKVFPDAYFIYLIRDPKDNISSIIDAWRSQRFRTYPNLPGFNGQWSLLLPPDWQSMQGKSIAEIAAFQWQSCHDNTLRALGKISRERWTTINYADFIASPEQELAKLADFTQLSMDNRIRQVLQNALPNSQYTLSQPKADKWLANKQEIEMVLPSLQSTIDSINSALHIDNNALIS